MNRFLKVALLLASFSALAQKSDAPLACTGESCQSPTSRVMNRSTCFTSTGRGCSDKLSDVVSVKDYGAPCDGLGDDALATASAIAALPSSGGVVDARSCYSMTIGSTLTISKAAVTLLLPAATISMGANQIVVAVGAHNVALVGAVPYGGSIASATIGNGTFLTYAGTTQAIKVGDSTGDTYGFALQDVTLGLNGAGTAAVGIQLNRCPMYVLTRLRVHGFTSANTQIAIDLEGGAQFTGGKIDSPYLWQGNVGVFYGQNANANYVTGGIIVNSSPGGGTCFNLAGTAGGSAVGNAIFGTDCEVGTGGTVISIDRASKNYIFGVRNESVTHYVNATANSTRNVVIGWSAGDVVDGSTGNTFPNNIVNVDFGLMNQSLWRMRNRLDASQSLDLWSGSTTEQQTDINLFKFDGTRGWNIRKNTLANLQVLGSNGHISLEIDQGTNTFINGDGSGTVFINQQSNSGTGGTSFGSGGASPTQVAAISAAGVLSQVGVAFASLGTPTNGRITYCSDCTIANPCASGGTGAFAKRLNGVWVCN